MKKRFIFLCSLVVWMENVKLVIVGDAAVGKTSLIITYASGKYPVDYIPTVFDTFNSVIDIDGTRVNVGLWDTAGQSEYSRLRLLSYPGADMVLICYTITSKNSLDNVKSMWVPEIQHYCPNIRYILVGTKLDLRDDKKTIEQSTKYYRRGMVSYEQGKQMARELNAVDYLECSSHTGKGVKTVFEHAVRLVLSNSTEINNEK